MDIVDNDAASAAYAAITSQLNLWGSSPNNNKTSYDIDNDDGMRHDDDSKNDGMTLAIAPPTTGVLSIYHNTDDSNAKNNNTMEGYHDALLIYLQKQRISEERLDLLHQGLSEENDKDDIESFKKYSELEFLSCLAKLCRDQIDDNNDDYDNMTKTLSSFVDKEMDFWNLLYLLRDNGVNYLLYTPTSHTPINVLNVNSPTELLQSLTTFPTPPLVNLHLRRCLILQWIQTSLSRTNSLLPPLKRRHMWPCTNIADPDYPLRTNTPLKNTDDDDERDLLSALLHHLQSGQYSELLDMCRNAGQSWRAASLSGIQDNNHEFRFLYKSTCRNLSQKAARRSQFQRDGYALERALYGIVGNDNLEQTLTNPVLASWTQGVFTYFYNMVERYKDEMLIHYHSQRRSIAGSFPFVSREDDEEEQSHLRHTAPVGRLTEGMVFERLMESVHEGVRVEARDDVRVLTAAVVTGMRDVRDCVASYVETDDVGGGGGVSVELARLLTHLVLYVSTIKPEFIPLAHLNKVLSSYIEQLAADSRHFPYVALYTSLLPEEQLVSTYSSFLLPIEDERMRQMLLHKARKFFPKDTLTILTNVITTILSSDLPSSLPLLPNISSFTLRKLHSISWLTFHHEYYPAALTAANQLLRGLLLTSQLYPAKYFLQNMFPDDAIEIAMQQQEQEQSDNNDDGSMTNVIHEFNAMCLYLQAHSSYETWRTSVSHILKISSTKENEIIQAQKLRSVMRDVWNDAREAEMTLLNFLQFPGGWLLLPTTNRTTVEDHKVREERVKLRKMCLPEGVFFLCRLWDGMGDEIVKLMETDVGRRVLSQVCDDDDDDGGEMSSSPFRADCWYRKALSLADLVARDDYGILHAFEKEEMEQFLKALAEVSVKLLKCGGNMTATRGGQQQGGGGFTLRASKKSG